jgi:hypothetical protein
MRRSAILILSASSLVGFLSFKSPTKNYLLTIKWGMVTVDKDKTIWVIPTTLTNNTDDTLKYYSMSCSWRELYLVNNSNLQVQPVICQYNAPIILTLAPGQKTTVSVNLLVNNRTDNTSEVQFKIGFNLIKTADTKWPIQYIYETIKKRKNVIWSNSIHLKTNKGLITSVTYN